MNQTVGQTSSLVEEPPEVGLAAAAEFLREQYGIKAELQALRSERDLNFLAVVDDGRQLVLKVSNSGDDPGQIEMESAAMRHLALVDPGLPIPRIVDTEDGEQVVTAKADDGRVHQVRVMTVMPGAVGRNEIHVEFSKGRPDELRVSASLEAQKIGPLRYRALRDPPAGPPHVLRHAPGPGLSPRRRPAR